MKPLSLMASDASLEVCGADANPKVADDPEFKQKNITVSTDQSGDFLRKTHAISPIDWYIHTSAMPESHPEIVAARALGLKITKRDEFIAYLMEKLNLKMIAVAGTHGKTTTTAMIIWLMLQMGIPASWLVGSSLPFAPAGHYDPSSDYFIYEADEYDHNFLKFHPWLSVITSVSYDHPDIYKTQADYTDAFTQFIDQSASVIAAEDVKKLPIFSPKTHFLPTLEGKIGLSGEIRRYDASLAGGAVFAAISDVTGISDLSKQSTTATLAQAPEQNTTTNTPKQNTTTNTPEQSTTNSIKAELIQNLSIFPGAGRRFEKIIDGFYSDYAHHPEEIAATVKIALEEKAKLNLKKLIIIYEPHQNSRQHEVYNGYKTAFLGVDQVFWLPTFLARENPDLRVIQPEEFCVLISSATTQATPATLNNDFLDKIKTLIADQNLVLLMTAGPADDFFRKNL